jgi:hypothetical protein
MGKRKTLTEADWAAVFAARCQDKQGRPLSKEERALCAATFESDRDRYAALDGDVFNATVPFGSNARWKEDPPSQSPPQPQKASPVGQCAHCNPTMPCYNGAATWRRAQCRWAAKQAPPEMEERPYTTRNRVAAMGKSSVMAECPFCGSTVILFLWALAGNGMKRCACGAAMHRDGIARRRAERTDP